MSDIADDIFDEEERNKLIRHSLFSACPCQDASEWFRNEEGFLECKGCGTEVDE